MKLSTLASRNYTEPGRIAYNAAMYVAQETHDGKEVLVCRPHAEFLDNEAFMAIFRNQGQTTNSYTTTRCLRYITLLEDQRGPYWLMTPGRYTSLAQLLVDKPGIRLEQKWVDEGIADLLETVKYIHGFDHLALEITPQSLLVTKDIRNHFILMPPLQDFLPLKATIWKEQEQAIAPELFNVEEPDRRADLYAVACIIKHLCPYASLPYKYSSIVKAATTERVDKRPASVDSLTVKIGQREKSGKAARIAASVSVVLAFLALVFLFPWSGDEKRDIQNIGGPDSTLFDDGYLTRTESNDPLVNTDLTSATEAEKDRMLDDWLHDSIAESMDTAMTLSPEMRKHQRDMMTLAAEKYRTALKMQARPILEDVYTPANMRSQDKFMAAYKMANQQLLQISDALCKQYQLDPTTATRISAEVFDEVANALKKGMQ